MTTDLLEQQREHFNSIAEQYFAARKHPNHLELKRLIWTHFFQRHVPLMNGVKSVLEPMCGMAEGYDIVSRYAGIAGFSYLGFDYSEAMVEIARKARPGLRIEQGDVTTFSSPIPPVDLIVLIGGLHHVYSRTGEAIKTLTAALKPGGYFLSFEPTHDNWLARRTRQRIYASNPLFDVDTEQGYERQDLLAHFQKAGYEKIDEIAAGLISYVLWYNPDAFPALNRGGQALVRTMFGLDRCFWDSAVGRKLSFATISLWRAPLRGKAGDGAAS
ncbi:class I SAM-dependent methyltransferase [Ramlibacter sp. AW1]|uniref:Class I SAM-dependent methyltransferase n=1 Tax=Ramlibacter aurantiacus TaxID=2801330 RepID=A0A936ZM13_9BURK|nr:class I SAM-dependent methyltransferase [Ramlibacter aurantiacus]MBL0422267.1 class I SAM-dependent methyltransferase [Ramlibacter aurantiacus]